MSEKQPNTSDEDFSIRELMSVADYYPSNDEVNIVGNKAVAHIQKLEAQLSSSVGLWEDYSRFDFRNLKQDTYLVKTSLGHKPFKLVGKSELLNSWLHTQKYPELEQTWLKIARLQ